MNIIKQLKNHSKMLSMATLLLLSAGLTIAPLTASADAREHHSDRQLNHHSHHSHRSEKHNRKVYKRHYKERHGHNRHYSRKHPHKYYMYNEYYYPSHRRYIDPDDYVIVRPYVYDYGYERPYRLIDRLSLSLGLHADNFDIIFHE